MFRISLSFSDIYLYSYRKELNDYLFQLWESFEPRHKQKCFDGVMAIMGALILALIFAYIMIIMAPTLILILTVFNVVIFTVIVFLPDVPIAS